MEQETGNFYMFGAVVLENPRYLFGPHPMTTAVFDAIVPCFALNDDDGSVVGTFEHYNDDFMYEVPGGTYHICAKVFVFLSVSFFVSDGGETDWSIHATCSCSKQCTTR